MATVSSLVGELGGETMSHSEGTRIEYVDSHTEGEPTRTVLAGAPLLPRGSLQEQLKRLKDEDWFRRSVILEPRGGEALVGAVLCPPSSDQYAAAMIFINNTGYLGMCGHGAIGVAVTLAYLGKIGVGKHLFETPVGSVEVELLGANRVAIENVASYRFSHAVAIDVPGLGIVTGDVAWGGNWFFLVNSPPCPLVLENIERLGQAARKIRSVLSDRGIRGENGAEIDHVEFFSSASSSGAQSRNYVFCPGGAYDRSPCGTGTSAKLACLAEEATLPPGEVWVQESIIGSRFECSYRRDAAGRVIPKIIGRAFICGHGVLVQQDGDPFRFGIDGKH